MKKFKILSFFIILILLLNSCKNGKLIGGDATKVSTDPKKRVEQNLKEGRGMRLSGEDGLFGGRRGGVFDFATANELWRASLDTIDFMPLASVNYSGGIIITDWYNDSNSSGQSVKISVRFLSNEVRSDALDIKIFTKNCDTSIDCKINENKGSLVTELTKSILKKATIYEKQGVNKRKSYENAALD
mgnify:CR=1 FL=1